MEHIAGFTIEQDREVLHPAERQGLVVSRTQVLREVATGKRFSVRFWTQWETGKLSHVTSDVLEVSAAFTA